MEELTAGIIGFILRLIVFYNLGKVIVKHAIEDLKKEGKI
ncbi:hypothetical protein Nther_2777 [Natranaerobius thermophilus JW/NM-WN-LF]|uniref:Uncharacterized protein n=1 Tax=Natranaerobius thermophilus (strain ATCC BAA-1301 / DSM 18059 / JW/NM-WN-LF) TaxID=457570 RepID=B2A2V9_NATTJ|nr:hypothetical protein Nther_2777 [Natranaerobius thermophilus JW/NM-WN-LF]